ncbi:hypothetical protein [Aquimarina mytili]|uniref:Lipoprotein n=1 Tax=Aquimarina mytili TaxID=874423 RepID=A0A936ZUU7_9FLAO|nr:hypothetical protein [Aquimarina mytili]MBL0682425.1 hypothetical protein [Aquimarina mytili]
MKKFLTIITTAVFIISCGKETKSKTESLPGTEDLHSEETSDVTQQEIDQALGEVFNDQIEMEIDESVFVVDNGSNRVNEEMTAGIMKMLAPQPYLEFKKKLEAEPENQNGMTSLGIEEVELGDKKVLVQKSMTVDEVGDKMIMMMHAFPAGNKTIMISSFFMQEEESKYLPLIEKSVVSARLRIE